MPGLAADVRYAFRLIRRAPGFAIGVISILAVGIGFTTALFSAFDQIVLRPLPYPDADRLTMVWEDFSAFGSAKSRVSPATYLDWARRATTFESWAALRGSVMNLSGSGAPEEVLGHGVTASFFDVLGVPPLLGRVFTPQEETPGHQVVVLSYRLWQQRFGADSGAIGRTITLSGEPFVVVGVMPRGFRFPGGDTEFWTPVALKPEQLTARNSHYLRVVARLRPDATLTTAQAEMRTIAEQIARQFPRSNKNVGAVVVPLKAELLGNTGRSLTILVIAAVFVLLIACANVANLLLARSGHRRREMAVRLAVGAGSRRLLQQLLIESFVLAALGAGAGLLGAGAVAGALTRFVPSGLAGSMTVHLDPRALGAGVVVTMMTALLFGLAPAIRLIAATGDQTLTPTGRGAVGHRRQWMRDALIVSEIAIALMLVAGAGLLVETLVRLRGMDPGFRADHVLTARLSAPYPKYADAAKRNGFYANILVNVRALPGVVRAGLASDIPYTSRGNTMAFSIEHRPPAGLGDDALFRLVSAGYLETIGARLVAGRLLADRDQPGTAPVVVINETFARQYWPGESPIGHRLDCGTGDGRPLWLTIVGVVADVRERGVDLDIKPAVYVPFNQTTIAFFQPSELTVETAVPPDRMANAVQRAVWTVDSDQPVADFRTMDDIVDEELAPRTQILVLLGTFACLALVLAAAGTYAVLSYLVSESRREIGLRMAIGATPAMIVVSVLRYSASLTMVGVAAGLVGAWATSRALSSWLYEVRPGDPVVLGLVALALSAVAALAAWVPARRAAAVDPMEALRAE